MLTPRRHVGPMAVRTFRKGQAVFDEGACGREAFIIQTGKVGLFRSSPEGEVEVAILGEGCVAGGVSLVTGEPYPLGARALETTTALVVGPDEYRATTERVPVWFSGVVKIAARRLLDAAGRADAAMPRDKERGLVSLLLLLVGAAGPGPAGLLDYEAVLVEAYHVCRLGKKDVAGLVAGLHRKGIVSLEESSLRKLRVRIPDLEVLRLYDEHLRLRARGAAFRECALDKRLLDLFLDIARVAAESAGPGAPAVAVKTLQARLGDAYGSIAAHVRELMRHDLVGCAPDDPGAIVLAHEKIARVKLLRAWLPRFEDRV